MRNCRLVVEFVEWYGLTKTKDITWFVDGVGEELLQDPVRWRDLCEKARLELLQKHNARWTKT